LEYGTNVPEGGAAGSRSEQLDEKLKAAADKLREAVAHQEESSLEKAHACLDLTMVLRMLGDDAAAALYAEQAVPAASAYLRERAESQQRIPHQLRDYLRESARDTVRNPEGRWRRHSIVLDGPRQGNSYLVWLTPTAADSAGADRREAKETLAQFLRDTDVYKRWRYQSSRGEELTGSTLVSRHKLLRLTSQYVRLRQHGLTVFQEQQQPAAFAEFRAIRRSAVRLGGFDYRDAPWFFTTGFPEHELDEWDLGENI
jgi:hypothetical protein